MRSKTVVLIVCDAIRWDYIDFEDSPFLMNLACKGVYCKKIRPSLGFCERAEMLSGTRPDVSGYLTALTFNKSNSDFKQISLFQHIVLKCLNKTADFFGLVNPFLHKLFSIFLIDRLFLRKIIGVNQPLYSIPIDFIRDIALTEDYCNMWEKDALSVETIFDVMREKNMSFFYETFASLRLYAARSDDLRVIQLFSEVEKQNYDFYLLYLGEGDAIGHKHGPISLQRRKMVKQLDTRIREIVKFFERKYTEVDFLIVGDHGMVDVKNRINVQNKIFSVATKNGLEVVKDYLFFLDSTMIRLWFNNKKSRSVFERLFEIDQDLKCLGILLNTKTHPNLHLPENLAYYGDLIWLANPGVVIFPDFFHKHEKVNGMHGYDPYIDEQKGFAILYSKNKFYNLCYDEKELIDVCATLSDLLSIRMPSSNQGKSWLS